MNLILLDERDRGDAHSVTLSDARAAHLLNVLRVAPGQTVRVGLLDGPLGVGTVESARDGRVTMRCAFETSTPPRPRVDVLLALPRPKVMRRLWAQLAALGVGQIILTNAERVERHYFDTHVLTEASYRPLLIEGLQQARDTQAADWSRFTGSSRSSSRITWTASSATAFASSPIPAARRRSASAIAERPAARAHRHRTRRRLECLRAGAPAGSRFSAGRSGATHAARGHRVHSTSGDHARVPHQLIFVNSQLPNSNSQISTQCFHQVLGVGSWKLEVGSWELGIGSWKGRYS